jgi:hypothetical protein
MKRERFLLRIVFIIKSLFTYLICRIGSGNPAISVMMFYQNCTKVYSTSIGSIVPLAIPSEITLAVYNMEDK